MTDIAVVAAEVGLVDPIKAKVTSYLAGSTITKGQAVALAADKYVDPADASADNLLCQGFCGVALNAAAAGEAVDVAEDAELEGFTVSGLNAGDRVYLSDTAGAFATTQGTMQVRCGKVVPKTDGAGTLVVRIQVDWGAIYSTSGS